MTDEVAEILKNAKFYAIDALNIKPTDIIVIRAYVVISREMEDRIRLNIGKFFPDNRVLIVGLGVELIIARHEDA